MTEIQIQKGKLRAPFRVLLYGPEGCGKTTLASMAPNPVFYDPNGRTRNVACDRYTGKSWGQLLKFLEWAASSDYDTIVIDELGEVSSQLFRHICDRDRKSDIEKYGYGKGYVVALQELKALTVALDAAGKNVILIGHSRPVAFKNPEGADYTRYEIDLPGTRQADLAGYLKQWSDAVLFLRYDTWASKDEDGKVTGTGTNERKVHTAHRAAYDAKNSYDMPEELGIDDPASGWARLYRYIHPPTAGELHNAIEALMPGLKDKAKEQATKYYEQAGDDVGKLTRTLAWMEKKAS